MRFLSLFLAFSLLFNIPLSANQAPSNPGIFSKAKGLAGKAIAYAKKGGKFLMTPHVWQGIVIAAYCAPYIFEQESEGSIKTTPVSLSELPKVIQDAVKDMNPQRKISFRVWDSPRCCANGVINLILIGKSLFSRSPEEQRYIMGHEIAHIEKNHHLKGAIGSLLIVYGIPLALAVAKYQLDQLAKNNKKDDFKGKCVSAAKKTVDFIVRNPIIPFAIIMTLCSRLSQYTEKEADIVSATKLNCAQGAVDYANHCIKGAKERAANVSWTRYFSPFAIADSISDALGWTRHDSRTKALEYLVPLAEQQKAL